MTSENKRRVLWFAILTLALVFRVIAGIGWDFYLAAKDSDGDKCSENIDGPFFYGDSDSYWKLARAIAFGRPYEFDELRRWQVFRTPGYPALLAPLFWIYGENPPVLAARIEGAFLGMLNVALVGYLATTIFGKSRRAHAISMLAALFVALDPTEVLQSISILSEEPFMSSSLLLDVFLIKAARAFDMLPLNNEKQSQAQVAFDCNKGGRVKRVLEYSCILALLSSASVYLRPSWLYFIPFAVALLVLFKLAFRAARRQASKAQFQTKRNLATVVCLALATQLLTYVCLSPWALRNYRLTGRAIVTTLQMGSSLYDGLSPNATGASDMRFVDRFREEEKRKPSGSRDEHFEIRLDRRMKAASVDWIKSHPLDVAKLACVKFYRLWAPFPREKTFSNIFLEIALVGAYLPILFLGLAGLFRAVRHNNASWFLMIPPLYVTSLHVIFVSSIRYRVPVMFCFAILSAYWIVSTLTERNRKNRHDRRLSSSC